MVNGDSATLAADHARVTAKVTAQWMSCVYLCDVGIWFKAHLCPQRFCKFTLLPPTTLLTICCPQHG